MSLAKSLLHRRRVQTVTIMQKRSLLNQLPIHRWLTFEDSWSPAAVEYLLDTAGIDSSYTVYDPFVGCGTTPVVCAGRGLNTISCDVSILATETTRVKLSPPSEKELNDLKTVIGASGPEKLLRSFVDRILPETFPDISLKLVQFVLAAALLRVGWHEGEPLRMDDVGAEIAALINEMREDAVVLHTPQHHHRVYCQDFFAFEPLEINGSARGKLVMVSSPPFFGSNLNPAKQRLVNLLAEPGQAAGRVRRPPARAVPGALPILSFFSADQATYDRVNSYLIFLESIARHAADTGCRTVALEMGPKNVGGNEIRFDLFLAQRLTAYNYEISLLETTETEPEICTAICARAR